MKTLLLLLLASLSLSSLAQPILVQHHMGSTELKAPAKRIVTLFQGATDAALALGIQPVGAVESWAQKPFYEYQRELLAKDMKNLGSELQPNLEVIAALQPDLIVATQIRHEKILTQLQQIAPTVILRTVYEYKESLKIIAAATGKDAMADEWLAQWHTDTQAFTAKAKAEFGADWPQEVTLLNFRADHARIYFLSFAGLVLKDLGFERPENHRSETWGTKLTSQESIPAMNSDVAFLFMEEQLPAVKKTYESWSSHPLWQTLDSVQNDAVYQVDEVIWNLSGGPLGARKMLEDINQHYGF